jgi:uncharacterized protein YPO0396
MSLITAGQFRVAKLQVYNWGTFSGVHDIPIAERGFLFVGRSGAGKTTLLDAFSALLVPPKWIDFNAAAREGDKSGRDRNLLSYVRGAWAEQQDDASGEFATQYLRAASTWSALSLTYRHPEGRVAVLVALFWIKGNSASRDDLRRHFFIFERPFDVRQFKDFQLDIRKLKQQFPDVFAREEFSPYAEKFRRLLSIPDESALRLLHKTQSAKNLGDLNSFIRDFMLEKPETFAAADRLVEEFDDLNSAHEAVVTARTQIATLSPARSGHATLEEVRAQEHHNEELRAGIDGYKETMRGALLKERISKLESDLSATEAEAQQRSSEHRNELSALEDLRAQHRESGGQRIQELETEHRNMEAARDARLRKRGVLQAACRALAWPLPESPDDFGRMTSAAREERDRWPDVQERARKQLTALAVDSAAAEKDFASIGDEVASLRRQSSNVPAENLRIRRHVAAALGLDEADLPFVAEWIEVLPSEGEWAGAIERVLRNFALDVMVEEKFYTAVSDFVNRESLRGRIIYDRVPRTLTPAPLRQTAQNALFRKVKVREGVFQAWIENALRQRFDFLCADSMQAFRAAEKAVTREGQIRFGKERHEKDDRFGVNDRSRWVLGFDNRAKLELFADRARTAALRIDSLNRQTRDLRDQDRQTSERMLHCQTLANLEWDEIDSASLTARLAALAKTITELREGNPVLRQLAERMAKQEKRVEKSSDALTQAKARTLELQRLIAQREKELQTHLAVVKQVSLSDRQLAGLPLCFNAVSGGSINIETLADVATRAERALTAELKTLAERHASLTRAIEEQFAQFRRQWPMEAGDLDSTLHSAPEFFAKLRRLETDRLPDYEQRFFDLLRNQSHQNLAALSTHLTQAAKTIREKLEIVNESLARARFNTGTFLRISSSDRNPDDVRKFRQDIQSALSHAWTDNREEAESRFIVLRGLVTRLASQQPADKHWRNLVLDVRQHADFIGREYDEQGNEIEIYRGGSGKSGGQRQKLATTCLAAALRYQLAGEADEPPAYAPVVLDEAFDKADNEFTALAMDIFVQFGFQMIVATPLKSVMTLERFIGGACFIDIKDRKHSSVLMIEYDDESRRLRLSPKEAPHAAVA